MPLYCWVINICKTKAEMNMMLNKWWNWSSCTKLALSASWTHGLMAQSVGIVERNSVVVVSNLIQVNFLYLHEIICQWWIPHVSSVHSATLLWLPQWNVSSNKRGRWRRHNPKRNMTLNKQWNWSSCTKLALSASWTHGLIAQSVRPSQKNLVVVGSNPTQVNFLLLLEIIRQWWISYVSSVHSATLMWLPEQNFNKINGLLHKPKWNVAPNKQLNWSSCTKLGLSVSWTKYLILLHD